MAETNENLKNLVNNSDDASFKETIVNLFSQVVNLEVKTVITDKDDQGGKVISTKINLLDGDITNTIPEGFIDSDKTVDFHLQQVTKAEQIIKTNLDTLKSLANTLKNDLG